MDYLSGGRADEERLERAGYRTLNAEGWEGLLPADLNPPRWRKRPITSFVGFYDYKGGFDPRVGSSLEHSTAQAEAGAFYFVKGDADLDRAF